MKAILVAFIFSFLLLKVYSQDDRVIENLGPNVNSKYHELAPVISADGKTLYFVRSGHPLNTRYKRDKDAKDIWFSKLDKNGEWGPAQHEEGLMNTRYTNSVYWVSPDGSRMLIMGTFTSKKRFDGIGFSMCVKTANGWSRPEELEIEGFYERMRGQLHGATMANDGKTMILYYSETEGSPLNDLYVSFLKQGNQWTKPKKILFPISKSKTNEMTPFIASDNVTLYFASDRDGGLGDMDIWKTTRLDDTWRKWSEPVNMGAPINTKGWDGYFTLDANGEYGYMVTTRDSHGGSDIVRIKMKSEDRPNPVVLVYGNVYNAKTKEPISAGLQYEILPDGIIAGYAYSNTVDGSYKIVLPSGKNYGFMATSEHFLSVSENLNLDTVTNYLEVKKDLYLAPIEIGQTIRLNNIFFDYGNATLRPESYPELDRVVKVLNDNSKLEIEMSGHTDNVGGADANMKLSEERASAVKEYLVAKSIPEKRIIAKGYGETKPIADNNTDEGRQLNRRVEFTILKN